MGKGGFSWKRATGVTKAKRRIAKVTGIPTTKSGRKRKAQRMMTGGCLLPVLCALLVVAVMIAVFA